MKSFNELQSVDRFTIHIPFPLSSYERKLITLLYQPLIGPEPISLYFLLWAEGEGEEERDYAHYHLMNGLDMSISSIFNARIALEAIGLLRTYKKEEEHLRYFAYDVMPPLEAKRFFEDPLLSMFLFSKIGESTYRNLLQRFVPKSRMKEGMVEVSRQFTDVYQPIQQHMPGNKVEATTVEKPTELPFYYSEFDFPLLMSGMSESLIPHRLITAEVKETISKIAFMYGLSAIEMKNVLIIAIGDNEELTHSAIKKAASEYYKLTISKSPPAITKMLPPEQANKQVEEWDSKQAELIEYFEHSSPMEVLSAISDGKQPFEKDIELFEGLVTLYDISIPVVNVLIHYVSMTSPGRMNKNYVDAIASEWRAKGIKTATQAMEVAREFMDKKNPQIKKNPVQNMHDEFMLLSTAAHKFYQFEINDAFKLDVEDLDEKFTALMKKAEPLTLLQMLADGKEPFTNDIKTVTQFASMYDFEGKLLNTLIHYASFASEGNLNLPFLESIAAGWRKQSVQTIEAAITYGANFRKSRTQKYSRTGYKTETVKELPSWINSAEKPKNIQSLEELERKYKAKKND